MARKRERLSRQGWKGNKHVPINGEVLKALLDERQWSQGELVRRMGSRFTNQQNISHILGSGTARRCRRDLRRRIAKVLEVPEELLGQEPFVPAVGQMVSEGTEFRYSTRTKLAVSRLLTLAATAVVRDLEKTTPHEESPIPPDWVLGQVLNWVVELVLIKQWRQKLIRWKPAVEAERGYTEPATPDAWNVTVKGLMQPPSEEQSEFPEGALLVDREPLASKPVDDPDHEAAVLALLCGVEHLLRPWFEDKAELNYAGLRDFAHLPKHPFAGRAEIYPITSPLAALPLPDPALANRVSEPTTLADTRRTSPQKRRRPTKRKAP
jgi:hypothetical protein